MEALFIVLNRTEYLDDILSGFIDIGIRGATILESEGMGHALVAAEHYDMPIFGSFKSLLENQRPFNKVIFSVIEEGMAEKAVKVVQDIVGDLTQPGVGMMFTIPVGKVYGLTKSNK